jgi:hypothetical protein
MHVLHLVKNVMFHVRTKHIDVQYHFICETVENRLTIWQKIKLMKISLIYWC